jgi:superfamily I DNA/RNA helicase
VRETKGLEFDVIIVPNLGSFELGCAIGRNQAYVAISRAKHALMIGCASDHVDGTELSLLKQNGLVVFRDVPLDELVEQQSQAAQIGLSQAVNRGTS